MKIQLAVLFLILLFSSACKDAETAPRPELSLDIVTGLNMVDENGNAIGTVGNPNINRGGFRIFPNPLINQASAFSLDKFITEIWILPAIKNTDFNLIDFENAYSNFEIPFEEIEHKKVMEFDFPDDNVQAVNLNFSNLETGYYRIFYQIKTGEIFWDNFFVDKESGYPELITNLIKDWE